MKTSAFSWARTIQSTRARRGPSAPTRNKGGPGEIDHLERWTLDETSMVRVDARLHVCRNLPADLQIVSGHLADIHRGWRIAYRDRTHIPLRK